MLCRTAFAVAALALVGACDRSAPEWVLSGPTMGTTYNVKVVDAPQGIESNDIREVIHEVLADIDRTMSGYRSDSEVARFNAAASTEWFAVSADVATVVAAALEVSAFSDGAFDITIAPLVDAWGFGSAGEPAQLPGSAALEQLRGRVGYQRLHVRRDPPALRKDLPELTIDLNGIAPGFAVDRLAQRLQSLRVANFMIDIGGEIQAHGRNAQREPWRIAVERPFDTKPEPYAIVVLDNAAVTTSGEYRHYYFRGGRRYSHTIDPRSGRPVEHGLGSVVVIGTTSMLIDAWATAFNVLGAQAGYELARRRNMPVMFIEAEGEPLRSRATPEFSAYLKHPTKSRGAWSSILRGWSDFAAPHEIAPSW